MNSPQSAPHEDAILARLQAMSEAELRHLITAERDDYVPRALELAEQELARRGESGPTEPTEAAPAVAHSAPVTPARTRWYDAWLALLGTVALANLGVAIAMGASFRSIVLRAAWAAAVVPFVLKVRRRRRGLREEAASEAGGAPPS